jgi:glycosyltransferase involved in cell wall biosynthesis
VRAEIDEVTLTIVGKNPPTDFFDYEKRNPNNVQVTGYVPDLDPYFQQAAIAVIPVRAGSGMRVRILEALARGMPLVTTSIGIEGIDAYHNKEVLIADTAHDYAEAVIRLLKDKTLQARLSANGRKLACEQYDWQVALRKMDRIYKNETE